MMKKVSKFSSVFNKNHKYPIYNIEFDKNIIHNLKQIFLDNQSNRFDLIKLKKVIFFIDRKLVDIINIDKNYSSDIEIIIKYESADIKNDNGDIGQFINKYITFFSSNNITPGDSLIVVIGGGGLINTIGFISSIYHRGLPLIYIPTTPLSTCDVAVGSKTGLNNTLGKNIIGKHKVGTYFDPLAICVNNNLFEKFYINNKEGFILNLAESIKHFILQDEYMLSKIINLINNIINKDVNYSEIENDLLEIILKTIELKDLATMIDPFEHNYGKILLYGHKHSNYIETITNYELPHDFSVIIGILIDLEIQKINFGIEFNDLENFLYKILILNISKKYIKILKESISNDFTMYLNDIKGESINNILLKFIKLDKLGIYAKRNNEGYIESKKIELFDCNLDVIINSFNKVLNKV